MIRRSRPVNGKRFSYRQLVLVLLAPMLATVLALAMTVLSQPRVAGLTTELLVLERWGLHLDGLQDRMLLAESAVRAFRLTGAADSSLLEPFDTARSEVPQMLEALRADGEEFDRLRRFTDALSGLVAERLRTLEALRDAPEAGSSAERAVARMGVTFSQRLSEQVTAGDRTLAALVATRESQLVGLARSQRYAWLLVPAGLVVTLAVAVRLVRRGNRSIQVLTRNILNLVEGRELEPYAPDGSQLEELAAALEQTSRMLESREAQRLAAQREAQRANEAKTGFLSRMSHELRTPLTAVLGFAELLDMDDLTDEQRDSVRHITVAGRHLLMLINEVLDISRIESGDLAVSVEPVELGEVMASALALMRPMAEERGIRLPEACGQGVFVRADRQRTTQVLLNLLSNAVKYNRPSGDIHVTCEVVDGTVRISVTDTGMGISPELLPRVFAAFDRLGAEQTGVEGTGVGLLLSKGLVEAMEGRLTLESVAGVGSTFTVELPQARQPAQPAVSPQPAPVAGTQEVRVVKVLYVEDNAANLDLVARFLQQMSGVELITTMQGSLAFDLARLHKPNLILLDLHLPDLDGETVLRRLRADPETAGVRIAMLTADATPGQERRLLALGADDYLTKPLDFGRLAEVIRSGEPMAPVTPA